MVDDEPFTTEVLVSAFNLWFRIEPSFYKQTYIKKKFLEILKYKLNFIYLKDLTLNFNNIDDKYCVYGGF